PFAFDTWMIGASSEARTELACSSLEPTESGPRSLAVSDWSATSEEVTEAAPRAPAVRLSGATSDDSTPFSAISVGSSALGAMLPAATALSRRSTVRIVPSTIWGERTVFLPTPAAMALPVRAANRATQAITRAGEGRNERVLWVLLVIGGLLSVG